MSTAKVVSVNVGQPRELKVGSRVRETGIFKEPRPGRIPVAGETVGDDIQVDKRHHGGRFKAVYAYSAEDLAWWSVDLGFRVEPGTFGENITCCGIEMENVLIGEKWRIGTAEIEATDPRVPCSTLAARMRKDFGVKSFVKRFVAARRFGVYFLISKEGDVAAGDSIEILHRPDHGVTANAIADLVYAPDLEKAVSYLTAFPRQEQKDEWMSFIRAVAKDPSTLDEPES
jgi:MOSC domain-containing protein YiiM